MHVRFVLLLFFSFCFSIASIAQDTIVLLSGKTIIAKGVEVGMYSVTYHRLKDNKQKRINPDHVFSIRHADGTERIVYDRDSIEEGEDYTIDQMRMFVHGEQDAIQYYKNNTNKIGAFVFGAGISYLGFYGIVGPGIYSTVIGSFSPDMSKQKISNPALLNVDEFKEGYVRKAREKNTVNSIYYGLAGFAAGFAAFSFITRN